MKFEVGKKYWRKMRDRNDKPFIMIYVCKRIQDYVYFDIIAPFEGETHFKPDDEYHFLNEWDETMEILYGKL